MKIRITDVTPSGVWAFEEDGTRAQEYYDVGYRVDDFISVRDYNIRLLAADELEAYTRAKIRISSQEPAAVWV